MLSDQKSEKRRKGKIEEMNGMVQMRLVRLSETDQLAAKKKNNHIFAERKTAAMTVELHKAVIQEGCFPSLMFLLPSGIIATPARGTYDTSSEI